MSDNISEKIARVRKLLTGNDLQDINEDILELTEVVQDQKKSIANINDEERYYQDCINEVKDEIYKWLEVNLPKIVKKAISKRVIGKNNSYE